MYRGRHDGEFAARKGECGYHTSVSHLAARDTHSIFRPNTLKTRLVVHVNFPPVATGGKFLFASSHQRPEIGYFAPNKHSRQDSFSMY